MTETKSTAQKLVYFTLGVGLPIAAYFLWSKTEFFGRYSKRQQHMDHLRDIAMEDSFPASDPPSAW